MNKSSGVKRCNARVCKQFTQDEVEGHIDEIYGHNIVRCQYCSTENACQHASVDRVYYQAVDQRVRPFESGPHLMKEIGERCGSENVCHYS